jgi:GNAT superfamily N-acetyltransferase
MTEVGGAEQTGETIRKTGRSSRETCTIRSPRSTDYDEMTALALQLGYPSTPEQIRIRLEEMGGNQHAVFVAELGNGQIAGWIGVYIFRSVQMDYCAFISGLIVGETVRAGGIGKELLNTAEDWALQHGCRGICVSSNVIRHRAHAFYSRNGYSAVKTQTTFSKNLQGHGSEEGCSTSRQEPIR